MNSIRFIGQAVEAEARRQIEILEDGGEIEQETRLFDPGRNETRAMRSKEEAHDYRYFPDPDLLPLEFSDSYVADLKSRLPEFRTTKKHDSSVTSGCLLMMRVYLWRKRTAEFFEAVVKNR